MILNNKHNKQLPQLYIPTTNSDCFTAVHCTHIHIEQNRTEQKEKKKLHYSHNLQLQINSRIYIEITIKTSKKEKLNSNRVSNRQIRTLQLFVNQPTTQIYPKSIKSSFLALSLSPLLFLSLG